MLKFVAFVAFSVFSGQILADDSENLEVNIYSYRQPFLIQPLLDEFTNKTGIKTNVLYAKQGLLERLRQEGRNTKADLVLTVDVSRLSKMADADLLQSVYTRSLMDNVPARYRHPDGLWYGLSLRARVIYASKERVPVGAVDEYEDLGDSRWKGLICTRSGKHLYQLGLVSSMIHSYGINGARSWLSDLKSNLARKPQGNDRAQVKAIKEGLCDLSLGNSYYMGKMLNDPKQRKWAESVYIIFPGQRGKGTHVNISGGAVTKYAKNAGAAIYLLEFLTEDFFQRMYSEQNFEYPVKDDVPWSNLLYSWGSFKMDSMPISDIPYYYDDALRISEQVGYDQ